MSRKRELLEELMYRVLDHIKHEDKDEDRRKSLCNLLHNMITRLDFNPETMNCDVMLKYAMKYMPSYVDKFKAMDEYPEREINELISIGKATEAGTIIHDTESIVKLITRFTIAQQAYMSMDNSTSKEFHKYYEYFKNFKTTENPDLILNVLSVKFFNKDWNELEPSQQQLLLEKVRRATELSVVLR